MFCLSVMDYSIEYVYSLRKKTEMRRPDEASTGFTIQPEAHTILDRIYIRFKRKSKSRIAYNSMLNRNIPEIAKQCGIKIVFYSARKTFPQLSNEQVIKGSIVEYCIIGDAVSNDRRVIGTFIPI